MCTISHNSLQDVHEDSSSSRPLYDSNQMAPGHTVQIGAYACTSNPPRHRITESPAEVLNRPWALTQKELEVWKLSVSQFYWYINLRCVNTCISWLLSFHHKTGCVILYFVPVFKCGNELLLHSFPIESG